MVKVPNAVEILPKI